MVLKVCYEMLGKINILLVYINGGFFDIVYFNVIDDFEKINYILVLFVENGVGYGGIFWDLNGGVYVRVVFFWFNW